MSLLRSYQLVILLGVAMWTCSGVAQATGAKIALLREIVVEGSSIYLSDLLPNSAPPRMRLAAQEIVVGQSPRPGSIRVFSSESMLSILEDDADLLNHLEVPEQIVIRRSGRLITKEEVTAAIQSNLLHNEALSKLTITPANVRFAASVLVSTTNADLRVTRIEVDHTLQQLNIWLVSGADPAILPFMVTVRPQGASGIPAGPDGRHFQEAGTETEPNRTGILLDRRLAHAPKGPDAIVQAGKMAQLHLISGKTTEMFLAAIALEGGALGQRIRVRLENSGRVLEAQVVGPGQLEAEF